MGEGERLRIGIVGAGGIVRSRHLPGFGKLADVEVVAVANRSVESGRRVAEEWHIAEVVADWRELVARPDVDAVVIGTWPYMHCPVTLAALEAGKHVFCQARMAMDLGEAGRMVAAAAEKSDRVTMLCPAPHGLKGEGVMRELLSGGYVGHPRLVRLTSLNGAYADPSRPVVWRQERRLSGNNVLALGIYAEVLHRWLGYVRRVAAVMHVYVPLHLAEGSHEMVRVEMPDSVTVIGEMESGAELNIVMSGAVPNGPEDTLEVFGDKGALIYNFAEDTICGHDRERGWTEIVIPADREGAWTAEADFVSAIRTGREAHPDFEDGYRYMEFVEAVWRSHGERRHVDLPLKKD